LLRDRVLQGVDPRVEAIESFFELIEPRRTRLARGLGSARLFVWALMGISIGSTAGAVIVNGTKANQNPAASMIHSAAATNRRGLLATNSLPSAARWSDLFKGDELVDCSSVDISKVQMFFFTVAVLYAYTGTLWSLTPATDGSVAFPNLSTSLVTLLGISHAGYLTVKAAPKTPTTIQ
jgi:hypothetical protein